MSDAANPPRFDLRLVAPELRGFLESTPPFQLNDEALPAWRNRPPPPHLPPPAPQIVERIIPGPADNPRLRVLLIDPSPGQKGRGALLHIHGGGFVMGSPGGFAPLLQTFAAETGCVIVSVEYRLAPEFRFPALLEDLYAALRWLHQNAAELGIDPARIAVGGESAGASLAASLAIAARDRGEFPIAYQFLIHAMLDDRTGLADPEAPLEGEFLWTRWINAYGWSSLLGVPAGSPNVPEGAVPARVKNLRGLPPALIALGAVDFLAPESLDYAGRLIAAGVATEVHVEPGAIHMFDAILPQADISKRFNAYLVSALKRGLGLS